MRYPLVTLCLGFALCIGCALLQPAVPSPAPQPLPPAAEWDWALNSDLAEVEHQQDGLKAVVDTMSTKLTGLQSTADEHSKIFEQFEQRLSAIELASRPVAKPAAPRRRLARVLFFTTVDEKGESTCPACIQLSRKIEPALKAKGWVIGDTDQCHLQYVSDPAIAKHYGVTYVPCLIIVEGPDDMIPPGVVVDGKPVAPWKSVVDAMALDAVDFAKWTKPFFDAAVARAKGAKRWPS